MSDTFARLSLYFVVAGICCSIFVGTVWPMLVFMLALLLLLPVAARLQECENLSDEEDYRDH